MLCGYFCRTPKPMDAAHQTPIQEPTYPAFHAASGSMAAEPCAGVGGFLTQTSVAIYITPQNVIDYIEANTP